MLLPPPKVSGFPPMTNEDFIYESKGKLNFNI